MKTKWLAALAVLLGLGLAVPLGTARSDTPEQGQGLLRFKQQKLTKTDMQRFIAAQKQLAPLSGKLAASGEKADPTLHKQVEQIARSSGFSTIEELGNVTANVSLVLAGLDAQTGQFTEPPDLIKKEIDAVKQNQDLSQEDRNQAVAEMEQALKTAAPLQYKENVAMVQKFQRELDQVLAPEQQDQQGPAEKQQDPATK
jgi:hypothetical protein